MMERSDLFEHLLEEGDIALHKLDEWAGETPDKTFIYYGETGLGLSFAEVRQRSDALAAGLASLGVAKGDRVSVLSSNSLVATISMFAAWRLGALYAPHNFNLRGQLLSYQINDTGPAVLITDPSFGEPLSEIGDELDLDHIVVFPEGYGSQSPGNEDLGVAWKRTACHPLSRLLENGTAIPDVPLDPHDPATIIYTSGTTGPAKGVVLGHRWINQYSFPLRNMDGDDEVLYCDLPLYHVGGVYALLIRALWKGNTVGLWNRFSPNDFWNRIASCGATSCILMDVMVPWLMGAPARPDDRANTLYKVHMQPLAASHHEVARRFGFDFVSCGFGQTESGCGFLAIIDQFGDEHGTPPELYRGMPKQALRERIEYLGGMVVEGTGLIPKGFMGLANPFLEVAIMDDNDNPLPVGEVGQIAFRPRTPGGIMQQYLNKPDATLKAWRNLWFHTGDAGVRDADGTYRFVDRIGGYFRVRGENVSSFEVESVLNTHPKIRAVAAVPVPARVGSEDDIAVFVELSDDQDMSEPELRAYAEKQMPKYMQPAYVRFIEALPITPTNKVQKYLLKKSILEELDVPRGH
ncbi:AMP-binding protein [Marinobacter sp. LN3S78]|uniref:AMP-binding protein n=1 Tax=Marinobacter sp. LN3S78 TaxID=3382300 RepID=UPI00387AA877